MCIRGIDFHLSINSSLVAGRKEENLVQQAKSKSLYYHNLQLILLLQISVHF